MRNLRVGDIVRLTGHKYVAIVMEVGEKEEEDFGSDQPWAVVKWINHPTLSSWWYQNELERPCDLV